MSGVLSYRKKRELKYPDIHRAVCKPCRYPTLLASCCVAELHSNYHHGGRRARKCVINDARATDHHPSVWHNRTISIPQARCFENSCEHAILTNRGPIYAPPCLPETKNVKDKLRKQLHNKKQFRSFGDLQMCRSQQSQHTTKEPND